MKSVTWDIDSIIQQLEHIRIEVEEDTHMTVLQKWWDEKDSYRDYVNLLLTAMWVSNNSN